LRNHLVTAPHSPARFRVNGTLSNVDAWYRAFNVGPDAAYYIPPHERVRIWAN
jgi:predicted metalloendopeptidase